MKATGRFVGVVSALLSSGVLLRPLAENATAFIHPLFILQFTMALLGLWATFHRRDHDYLLFVALVAFVLGFGWSFILQPFPIRWIGIGNLGYVVAWRLLRDPHEVVRNEARPL